MANEVKLPKLGKRGKADVLEVKVAPGDEVTKGQPLLEIDSEKGTADVPSPLAGRITEVRVKKDDVVESGQVIALIEPAGGAAPAKPVAGNASPPKKVTEKPAPPPPKQAERPAAPPRREEVRPFPAAPPLPTPDRLPAGDGVLVLAGPATRNLARRLGVDLRQVRGSGKNGRVTPPDVEAFVKHRLTSGPVAGAIEVPELPDFEEFGPVERQPLKSVRRATAEHMSLCWRVIPHVTQHDEADITDLESFRQQQKNTGVKLTVTAFALKACAVALKQFPEFNASLDTAGEQLILKKYINIGVAVDTEHGLLVPVLRDVDHKSVEELGKELTRVAEDARKRKVDMQGGCFTISNLGGIGGTGFTPIVNWPEVAILGMSRSKLTPVYRDGQLSPRLILPLSLSYDHRVIDGAAAARFTRFLAELLENPWKMLMHA